ncbi:MAG: LemA family protein [Bacilli bacterium]|nr:LemA family protein [Bacilli bacterium]MDD4282414.1 LemA family protein [Bacilli bacterium]MDD4718448.1 LemA family protein [Bacilli bacterium]
MDLFIYILILIIITCFILIWYIGTFNNYQDYIIRINEAETNIDTILRKRFDLLNKSIGVIKANSNAEGEILEMIVKLRSRKLTNFDLDRQIYEAINEFHNYGEQYEDLRKSDSFIKIEIDLNGTEADIIASRKYYNDIITDYNKLVTRFPSNIVSKFCHYDYKPYFDGKDMTDEIVNDFKL